MNNFKTRIFMADTQPLQSYQQVEKYLDLITLERREKVCRLKSVKAQALSVGAEVLMKIAIRQCFDIKEELILRNDTQGKPRLLNYPEIHFNLSHSGNFVACAVADEAVGLDLQKMDRFNPDLARRYFAKEEVTWLFGLPVDKQYEGFFDLWAIKESYMKYTGRGFSMPMNSFVVRMEEDLLKKINPVILENGKKIYVFLKKYDCPDNYVLWSCCGSNAFEEALGWVNFKEEV